MSKRRGDDRLRVLLTTEGTYPHTLGGVSTWCHTLIEEMPEVDFTIFAHMMNPFIPEAYERPSNTDLVPVPIWGVEEPAEFNPKMSPRRVLMLSSMMDEATAKRRFCPLLAEFLEHVLDPDLEDPVRFGEVLYAMHRYFRNHDYRSTFRTRVVWETFREAVLRSYGLDPNAEHWEDVDPEAEPSPQEIMQRIGELRSGKDADEPDGASDQLLPRLFEATEAMRLVYRMLTPLNYEVPEADVVHATAAAFCGIPGIIRKIESGTPFLVTEHGVYMREQMLFLGRIGFPYHLRRFFIQFVTAVSRAVYHYADQVSPVCEYNARWETHNGVTDTQLQVIYNGVDPERFRPRAVDRPDEPTVVLVSRVDHLKDLETALRVAVKVRERLPNVRFRHFGPSPDRDYAAKCRALWKQLGLERTFEWMGSTRDAAGAYNQGDVTLLTSISEAFPYTVIEAMMCGKPVVSTNVGGVPEAVADLGHTARIRDVDALAAGVIDLLQLAPESKAALDRACRARTLELFTINDAINAYRTSYRDLAAGTRRHTVVPRPRLVPVPTPPEPSVPLPLTGAPAAYPPPAAVFPVVVAPPPAAFAPPAVAAPPIAFPPPTPAPEHEVVAVAAATPDEHRQLLASPRPAVRRGAVAHVADMFDPVDATELLLRVLQSDPDAGVRSAAAAALGDVLGASEEVG